MRFSRRTEWNQESNALTRLLEELKSQSTEIIDLTESNPTRCGFDYPPGFLQGLSDPKSLQYTPDARGMDAARQAVGKFCGFDPARILLTASTSESYSFLCRLLLDPGDKVLVPSPSYPLFQFLLELNDAAFDYYPLVYEGHWRIDFERLERMIDGRTKAIILVNPNNPTGSYLKEDELKQLNALCRKHNLVVISDEVFFDYPLAPGRFATLKDNPDVLTFCLGGLSKSLALPQMKLGWILASGPQREVEGALERLEIIADTFLSVNTPVQNACGAWLAQAGQIQGQVLQRVKANLQTLRESGLNVLVTEGGWYAVVDIGAVDEEQAVLDILKKHHILVHPGFFFDFEEPGHLVLSLLPKAEDFVKIVPVLKGEFS